MLDTEIIGKRLYVYNSEKKEIELADIVDEVSVFGTVIGFSCKTATDTFTAPRNHLFRTKAEGIEFLEMENMEQYQNEYNVLKNNEELHRVLGEIVSFCGTISDTKKKAILHRLNDILIGK